MTILRVEIPEAGYGKKVVIRNIKLEIKDGEVAAFIGPNGAGKSTLLKAIMGIIKTPAGKLVFDGNDLTSKSPEAKTVAGICLVPQGNRVFTELSILENLEVGGYLVKNRKELHNRIQQTLRFFPDLISRLKQNAGMLSGGEKQQLALARALVLQPKVLMLDEPSLGLTPKLVTKAFEIIKGINKSLGITVLIVEQKVREVLNISDRVYALRMGEIVFEGSSAELVNSDKLKEIFLV